MDSQNYFNAPSAVGGEQKHLHIVQCTPNAELTSTLPNTVPAPPSYESLYPSTPPAYESLPPPPPAYESFDSPPPSYDTLYPPPPPYSARACSLSSPRPTLPPLSTLLSFMGAAPSSPPPPPYTPLPTSTASLRFPVFHARYYGAIDHDDSSRDRHALFVLTNNPGIGRGVYLGATGSRRRGLRARQTPGDAPEKTRRLRESRLLGSVAAKDLGALWGVCRRVQLDRFPVPATKHSSLVRTRPSPKRTPCHFLLYTNHTPPPPYNDAYDADTLASPSQEWVAVVIALALARGLLQGN